MFLKGIGHIFVKIVFAWICLHGHLQDESLLAKLSEDDVNIQKAKYHSSVL